MYTSELIKENDTRNRRINKTFNPLTGEGSILERVELVLSDFSIKTQYIPKDMMKVPLVKQLKKYKSIRAFIEKYLKCEYNEEEKAKVVLQFTKVRVEYDFCFWAYSFGRIKNKFGGKNIPFKLNRPQRKLLTALEKMRLEGKPIRIILLKARQWGGSTLIQIYMAWIQLVHKEGFYSAIVAQDSGTSRKIRAMYSKLLKEYSPELLGLPKNIPLELTPYEGSHNDTIITQKGKVVRDSVICIGTAERPDSIRGGDISLVHMSEVGLWKATAGKTPEDIIRSVSSSVLLEPLTMDVIESTANGTGNFFHTEWLAAKDGTSERIPVFVAWYEIDMYSKPFKNEKEKEDFVNWIIDNRENKNEDSRSESGQYYWWLWNKGATLEAINWYKQKRRGYTSHADMAAEFPSDDIEAFKHSGAKVFNQYKVEELRKSCKDPKFIGDVYGDAISGKKALSNIRFAEDKQGVLCIWDLPGKEKVSNRYLTIVDVGGRSDKADFSDIWVLDRYWMMEGDKPVVVAEWHGHIDHDLLAWKAAQIASFYNNSLLVIESNTLETKDKERDVDGDHTQYILNQISNVYKNLYARKQSEEEIMEGAPKKWGFHTNTSTKPMIIDNLVKCVREKSWVERCSEAIDELLCYEKKQNGSFGAIVGKHDDRLMVRAIGLFICFCDMELPKLLTETKGVKSHKKKSLSEATI